MASGPPGKGPWGAGVAAGGGGWRGEAAGGQPRASAFCAGLTGRPPSRPTEADTRQRLLRTVKKEVGTRAGAGVATLREGAAATPHPYAGEGL